MNNREYTKWFNMRMLERKRHCKARKSVKCPMPKELAAPEFNRCSPINDCGLFKFIKIHVKTRIIPSSDDLRLAGIGFFCMWLIIFLPLTYRTNISTRVSTSCAMIDSQVVAHWVAYTSALHAHISGISHTEYCPPCPVSIVTTRVESAVNAADSTKPLCAAAVPTTFQVGICCP
jgi:hypothetical protein